MIKNNIDTNIDTNINNYDIQDLFDILNIDPNNTNVENVINNSNTLIDNLNKQNKYKLANFIKSVKNKLISYLNNITFNEQSSNKLQEWYYNQYPSKNNMNENNINQNNKITERNNVVQTFDNNHFQMNRTRLGVNQNYNLPVSQGYINPNLKNIISRTVCIDSQYRYNIFPYSFNDINSPSLNTNFTIDLSEPLFNILSISLYSVQIPTSWYNIDSFIGNNCFEVESSGNTYSYSITPGNYTATQLQNELNNISSGSSGLTGLDFSYNSILNKFVITNNSSFNVNIYFFKTNGFIDTSNCKVCNSNTFQNNSFGWTIGFRNTPDNSGNIVLYLQNGNSTTAQANVDLYGPKYCMVVIDDFNKNRVNKGLINSSLLGPITKLPEYSSEDNLSCFNNEEVYQRLPQRKLTQAQLYTLNSVRTNMKIEKYRFNAPTTNDIIGLIPIDKNNISNGVIVSYGVDILQNTREYFGPVDIERLKVKLVDDKGRIINLNGLDWSFSLHVKQLYQY